MEITNPFRFIAKCVECGYSYLFMFWLFNYPLTEQWMWVWGEGVGLEWKFNLDRKHWTGIKSTHGIRLSPDKLKLFDLSNAFQLEVRKILFTKFYPLFNQYDGKAGIIFMNLFEKDPFSVISLRRCHCNHLRFNRLLGPRLLRFSSVI